MDHQGSPRHSIIADSTVLPAWGCVSGDGEPVYRMGPTFNSIFCFDLVYLSSFYVTLHLGKNSSAAFKKFIKH